MQRLGGCAHSLVRTRLRFKFPCSQGILQGISPFWGLAEPCAPEKALISQHVTGQFPTQANRELFQPSREFFNAIREFG